MVVLQNYVDLIQETLKNNPSVNLTLPSPKDSFLRIDYENIKCCSPEYSAKEPVMPFAQSELYQAGILSWRRLSALDNNCKDIYEIDLDVSGSNFDFKPGDTIGIIPKNREHEVNTIINYLGLKDVKSLQYTLSIEPNKKGKIPVHIPVKYTIVYTLTHCVDLRGVIKKLFLLALSRHTKDKSEKRVLEYLCSKEGSALYTSEILNKSVCILDLLSTLKSCRPPIEVLFEHLPRLLPRPYSIVNSPHTNPNIIKICFSVMEIGNQRKGLTTGWLEDLIVNSDSLDKKMEDLSLNNLNNNKVQIYLRQNMNGFALPSQSEAPIILIGPGTGVSPFIGFLEERKHMRDKLNIQIGPAILFFGCRNPNLDYLYETEMKSFLHKGVLNYLLAAFSRLDGCDKKYVQGYCVTRCLLKSDSHSIVYMYLPYENHQRIDGNKAKYLIGIEFTIAMSNIFSKLDVLVENGAEVTKLIKKGAFIYFCGDIKAAALQVKEALKTCLINNDNLLEQDAEKYLSDMQKEKRFLIDVWN